MQWTRLQINFAKLAVLIFRSIDLSSEKARAEFTIEPFTEGDPGPHVKETISVAKRSGLNVEIGPFGTTVTGEQEKIFELVSNLLKTAMENGASRVSLQVTSI
ncbi:MAG TPA: hypothetical protein DCQ88_09820 [Acidimicrobiaceae bacterium]|nr:hypothetical protein [Acidimicrobiaceae bacterium]